MLDVLRFWLERGADGFRIDALRQCIKDDQCATTRPTRPGARARTRTHALLPEFTTDRPEVQDVIRRCAPCSTRSATDRAC